MKEREMKRERKRALRRERHERAVEREKDMIDEDEKRDKER